MSPPILDALRQRRSSLQTRWETLLRVEPVNTPLALPDAMAHLIPDSLDEIFRELARTHEPHLTLQQARRTSLPLCGCNRNPYLAHFKAAEQALLEELVLIQAGQPRELRREQDLAEIVLVTRRLGGGELEAFCSLCVHRGELPGCRHYAHAH
jgi:hypothetical protein